MASEKVNNLGRVAPRRNKYQAFTRSIDKKAHYLGAYDTREDAIKAVHAWSRLHSEGIPAAKAAFDIRNLTPSYTLPADAPIRAKLAMEIGTIK